MIFEPPYYSVIFAAQKRNLGEMARDDYDQTALRMMELAQSMPGFLGVEAAYQKGGYGITISYWKNEKAIKNWRDHAEHALARQRGKEEWYTNYILRVAKVERAYDWNKQETE